MSKPRKRLASAQAEAPTPPEPASSVQAETSAPTPLKLPANAPLKWEEAFIRGCFTVSGVVTICHYRGEWYRWTGTHYTRMPEPVLINEVLDFLDKTIKVTKTDTEPFNPTPAQAAQVLSVMRARRFENTAINPPFRRTPNGPQRLEGRIILRNGLFDPATKNLEPHDPLVFAVNCLPFDYEPAAPKPTRWTKFLQELWPGDDGKPERDNLQKLFGLLLTNDTSLQKIFLFQGPKRAGKGTIAAIIEKLIGSDNVAPIHMHQLTGEFGVAPLIDKSVAIMSDARIGAGASNGRIIERLLSISGEDGQSVNRKYRDHWHGQLGVRFVIMTNELPQIKDSSGALASRFVIWAMIKSFYGSEDTQLRADLASELPGILNWALSGLDMLRQEPTFAVSERSAEALQTLEALSSPISLFLSEWCKIGDKLSVKRDDLFSAYQMWCSEDQGMKPEEKSVFGRNLRAVLPRITSKGRARDYVGLTLSAEGREQWEQLRNRREGKNEGGWHG